MTGLSLSPDGGSTVRGVRWTAGRSKAMRSVIAMGPWSVLACQLAAAAGGVRSERATTSSSDPTRRSAARAVRRTGRGGRREPFAGGFPQPDGTVYVCGLSGETGAAGGSRRRGAGRRGRRTAAGDGRAVLRRRWQAERRSRPRPAIGRSRRRLAADGAGGRDRGRLCGDRAQLLGDPERAGQRRGHGRTDRRRRRPQHRPDARSIRPGCRRWRRKIVATV